MKTKTRLLYTTWLSRQADLNGVAEGTVIGEKQFSVDPSVQQKLIDLQRESSEFLGMINYVPVDEQSGEKLGLGVAGTLAGRTNTDQNDRSTRDPTTLDADRYECKQTNFDTHVTYAKLDLWAKFKDFQARLRGQVLQQQARDNIMIGWNGIVAAAQTDRAANPLLQDVNIGWLQQIRSKRPTHVFAAGGKVANKIVIAKTRRRLSQPGRPGLRRHRQVPAGMGPGRHRTGGHRRQRPAAREIFPHGRRGGQADREDRVGRPDLQKAAGRPACRPGALLPGRDHPDHPSG